MQPRILIAGIGNMFFGDDAFGCEVVRMAKDRPISAGDGIRIVDFGIRTLDLAYALLDSYELVILVDVSSRGGVPGSLYLIEPEMSDLQTAETHRMDVVNVLALARTMGASLKQVLLVACEPGSLAASVETEDPLSVEVRAAVPEAIRMIETLVVEACTNYQSH